MRAILFDLDGTLLPMDMDKFTTGYFKLLAKKAAPRGYEPKALVDGIWKGTKAMVQNDGSRTNKERFWTVFAACFGEKVYDDIPLFDEFYSQEFNEAVAFTAPIPEKAQEAVRLARARAEIVILATNPIFPLVGVETRLRWLGLKTADFDAVTSYENSSFCKPSPQYYQALLSKMKLNPSDCLMIGNDVTEDILAAQKAGLKSYLLQDCAINPNQITVPRAGSFDDLLRMLKETEQ